MVGNDNAVEATVDAGQRGFGGENSFGEERDFDEGPDLIEVSPGIPVTILEDAVGVVYVTRPGRAGVGQVAIVEGAFVVSRLLIDGDDDGLSAISLSGVEVGSTIVETLPRIELPP